MTTNDSRRGSAHHRRAGARYNLIRPMAIPTGLLLALSIAGPVAADAVLVTSSPDESAPAATTADALGPIAAGLVAVAAIGVLVLRRSRRA